MLAIVNNRFMQPLAFKIVLDRTTSLNGSIDTDADNTEAEETKHCKPLEDRGASTFSFDLS